MQTKEQAFWNWFEANEEKYYHANEQKEEVYQTLNEQLELVDEDLTFEFSPIQKDSTKELFISADGIERAFPAVEKLVAKAPKIKNWRITAFRQPTPGTEWRLHYKNIIIGFDDVFFRYAPDSAQIHIELNIRNFKDNSDYRNAAYLFLDGLLGEYDTETYIGDVDFIPLDEKKRTTLFPSRKLRDFVKELKLKKHF